MYYFKWYSICHSPSSVINGKGCPLWNNKPIPSLTTFVLLRDKDELVSHFGNRVCFKIQYFLEVIFLPKVD